MNNNAWPLIKTLLSTNWLCLVLRGFPKFPGVWDGPSCGWKRAELREAAREGRLQPGEGGMLAHPGCGRAGDEKQG